MTTRRHTLAALVGLALIGALSAAGADGAASRGCKPAGSRTIIRTKAARAYSTSSASGGRTVWACLFSARRPVKLGTPFQDIDVKRVAPVVLAGRYAGFQVFFQDHYGGGHDAVKSIDLRSGAVVHRWRQSFDPTCGQTNVVSLKLTPRGSLAWTDRVDESGTGCGGGGVFYEVWRADAIPGGQLLDSGASVDPHSLAVRDHTMSSRDGQTTRSASNR